MRYFLLSSLLFISLHGIAQTTFRLASSWSEHEITVNGQVYTIDSVGITIETHYPGFDTLVLPFSSNIPILCNFKPNREYLIVPACCATLDVVPKEKEQQLVQSGGWLEDDYEDMSRIQDYLMDQPTFSVGLTRPASDSIFFWSADYACEPKIVPVTETPVNYGSVYKCFYWSNITFLQFYSSFEPREFMTGTDGLRYDYLPNFEEIEDRGTIAVRLFDDHHFNVELNSETCEIYLRYDD